MVKDNKRQVSTNESLSQTRSFLLIDCLSPFMSDGQWLGPHDMIWNGTMRYDTKRYDSNYIVQYDTTRCDTMSLNSIMICEQFAKSRGLMLFDFITQGQRN